MNEAEIVDALYRDFAFCAGGLRVVLGVGINSMNVYTITKASQGIANYVNKQLMGAK